MPSINAKPVENKDTSDTTPEAKASVAAKNDSALSISAYEALVNNLPDRNTLTNFNKAHPALAKVGLFAASATVVAVGALAARAIYNRAR